MKNNITDRTMDAYLNEIAFPYLHRIEKELGIAHIFSDSANFLDPTRNEYDFVDLIPSPGYLFVVRKRIIQNHGPTSVVWNPIILVARVEVPRSLNDSVDKIWPLLGLYVVTDIVTGVHRTMMYRSIPFDSGDDDTPIVITNHSKFEELLRLVPGCHPASMSSKFILGVLNNEEVQQCSA